MLSEIEYWKMRLEKATRDRIKAQKDEHFLRSCVKLAEEGHPSVYMLEKYWDWKGTQPKEQPNGGN